MKQLFCYAIIEFKIAYYISNFKSLLDSRYPSQVIVHPPLYESLDKNYLSQFKCYYSSDELYRPRVTYISETNDIIENFSTNVNAFLQYINSKIIMIFIPYQDETTYKLIKEFYAALDSFCSLFPFLNSNIAKEFSEVYSQCKNMDSLHSKCQKEIDIAKNKIIEMQKTDDTKYIKESLNNMHIRKTNLDFLLSILSNHTKMCTLFEKLTDGKSLLPRTEH